MSTIDRALVSPDREDHYLDVTQRVLTRPISNHFPILVEAEGIFRGKSPFRFENMWLKLDGFKDRVLSWWNRYSLWHPEFCSCQEAEGFEGRYYSVKSERVWKCRVLEKRTAGGFEFIGC